MNSSRIRWRFAAAVISILLSAQTVGAQGMVPAATNPTQIAEYAYVHLLRGLSMTPVQQDSARRIIHRAATESFAIDLTAPLQVVRKQWDAVLVRRDSLLRDLFRDAANRRRLDENLESS
jgi:hypothetical protein